MSKKEYGKGFTLEDLQAQRQSIWDTRKLLGLKMEAVMSTPNPIIGPGPERRIEEDGPLWRAMARQDPIAVKPGEAFLPVSDTVARGQRAMASMLETVSALGVTSWPKPYLPGDPVPETRAEAVGYFGGLPVFESNQVPQRFSYRAYTDIPGFKTTQVGWAKPEPIPEQPKGRFQNLDFEL